MNQAFVSQTHPIVAYCFPTSLCSLRPNTTLLSCPFSSVSAACAIYEWGGWYPDLTWRYTLCSWTEVANTGRQGLSVPRLAV